MNPPSTSLFFQGVQPSMSRCFGVFTSYLYLTFFSSLYIGEVKSDTPPKPQQNKHDITVCDYVQWLCLLVLMTVQCPTATYCRHFTEPSSSCCPKSLISGSGQWQTSCVCLHFHGETFCYILEGAGWIRVTWTFAQYALYRLNITCTWTDIQNKKKRDWL